MFFCVITLQMSVVSISYAKWRALIFLILSYESFCDFLELFPNTTECILMNCLTKNTKVQLTYFVYVGIILLL